MAVECRMILASIPSFCSTLRWFHKILVIVLHCKSWDVLPAHRQVDTNGDADPGVLLSAQTITSETTSTTTTTHITKVRGQLWSVYSLASAFVPSFYKRWRIVDPHRFWGFGTSFMFLGFLQRQILELKQKFWTFWSVWIKYRDGLMQVLDLCVFCWADGEGWNLRDSNREEDRHHRRHRHRPWWGRSHFFPAITEKPNNCLL